MAKTKKLKELPDLDLSLLGVKPGDAASRKFLMLIEGVYGIGVQHAFKKYGYSEQRFYQLLTAFKTNGFDGLVDRKRGPKKNSRRTDVITQQIIRQRFLDPDASAAVIAQKLKQSRFAISKRSVERTIQEFGLQKKTLSIKSQTAAKKSRTTPDKAKHKKHFSNPTK
jgi:transposase